MSVREDLKAYLDGELSPERAAEVQAALDQDPALREEYLFMRILSGEIKAAAREPAAVGQADAVRRLNRPSAWQFWRPKLLAAGGVVSAVFLIGIVAYTGVLSPQADEAAAPAKTAPQAMPLETSKKGGAVPDSGEGFASAAPAADGGSAGVQVQPTYGIPRRNERGYTETQDARVRTKTTAGATAPLPTVKEYRRLVVRSAHVGVKVPDVGKATAETETQVMALGGIVGDTNFNAEDDQSSATMDVQVPEKNFSAVLDYLAKLGKVFKKSTSGRDVTAEVADTDGRIRALAHEEQNLIAELTRTRNSSDRWEIRRRLSTVRQEVEGLKEVNAQTKDLAAMSRLTVEFRQSGQLDSGDPNDWLGQTTTGASNVLGFFARVFGVGLIYSLYLAPVWAPIVAIAWWLRRRASAA